MRLNLRDYTLIPLRSKLAEFIARDITKGIQTTKYPPEILNTVFFFDLEKEKREFLFKFWTSFDIFKPIFEIVNEIPYYKDYILYEVKSKLITEKNIIEMDKPEIYITLNQKKFFEECIERSIPVKIFLIFYLSNWEVEYKEFNYKDVKIHIEPPSVWHEEKMRRIKASKLNQFWHDLFPDYVLYKVNEKELEEEEINQMLDYAKEIDRTPLSESEKEMLIEIAKKKNEDLPIFLTPYNKSVDVQKTSTRSDKKWKKISIHKKHLRKIKKKYPNAYESWTKAEEDELSNLFHKGKKLIEISEAMGRQPGAIRSRLRRLGLLDE